MRSKCRSKEGVLKKGMTRGRTEERSSTTGSGLQSSEDEAELGVEGLLRFSRVGCQVGVEL